MAELPIPDQSPTLSSVIAGAISRRLDNVRVALPARVESYDATTQQAIVQPLIYDGFYDESGARQTERPPAIAGVPVLFLGAGDYAITWPLKQGDTGLLVFSSSSLDAWLVNGGEVDPKDDRRHNISDAVFIPGLRDFGHPVPAKGVDASAMVVSGGSIKLGDNTASDPVVRKSDLAAFVSEYLGHTHTVATTGTATAQSGTAAAVTTSFTTPACSPVVKIK